ncbi:MAG: HK97 gp10 family phage protein [Oscillospiraceae bacterium]|nr:HK97 gp10 family phage protein [Oscillospiraceae bacterium]
MAVKVDALADALAEELRGYSEEVTEAVKESVDSAGKECVKILKKTSPKDTGDYAQGWRKRKAYESKSDLRVEVHNETDYQLTHLLEDGYAHVTGGRVDGKPHIGPAAEQASVLLEKDVKYRIGRN